MVKKLNMKKEKRDEKLVVKVTKSEKEAFAKEAAENNMTVSEYIRQLRKEYLKNSNGSSLTDSSENKTLAYVKLVDAIDCIEDDMLRVIVGTRLEEYVCH